MPAKWLKTLDGRNVAFADINIRTTEADFGLPPAEIAAIIADQGKRTDVDAAMVTASQAESGARQLFLEATRDYALVPSRQMKALMGTGKHSIVNVEESHADLIVERRFVSKCGRFSSKIDSYVPNTLDDFKAIGSFKVKKMLQQGVEAEGKGYLYQLNLAAWLMRDHGFTVDKTRLVCRPSDCGFKEKKEFSDLLGYAYNPEIPIVIDVPQLGREDTFAPYEALWAAKHEAMTTGTLPGYCTSAQTWGGKKCSMGYCPVAEVCLAAAIDAGEIHPYLKATAAA